MSLISPASSVQKSFYGSSSAKKPLVPVSINQASILQAGNAPPITYVVDRSPLNVNRIVDTIRSDSVRNRRDFPSKYGPQTGIGAGLPRSIQKKPRTTTSSITSALSRGVDNQLRTITDPRFAAENALNKLPRDALMEGYNDTRLLLTNPSEYWRQNSFENPDNLIRNLRAAESVYGFVKNPAESIVTNEAQRRMKEMLSAAGLEDVNFLVDLTLGSNFEKVEVIWNTLDSVFPGLKDQARQLYDSTVGSGVRLAGDIAEGALNLGKDVVGAIGSAFSSNRGPASSEAYNREMREGFRRQAEGWNNPNLDIASFDTSNYRSQQVNDVTSTLNSIDFSNLRPI